MESNKKAHVSIEIYDADGEYCESFRGRLGYEEIRERMIDALKNDGIPVIRQRGKHETVEAEKKEKDFSGVAKLMTECIQDWGKPKAIWNEAPTKIVPLPMRMMLDYEFDGIKFHAAGNAEDVHKANEALLKRVFEE